MSENNSQFNFSLVAPTKTVLKDILNSLTVPTKQGLLTILPNHAPIIAELAIGEVTAMGQEITHHIHIDGGTLHVDRDHSVVLLADDAEHHYDIDIEEAEAAKKRAEVMLETAKSLTSGEVAYAKNLLEKSLQRINIVRKHSHRRKSPITSEGILEE